MFPFARVNSLLQIIKTINKRNTLHFLLEQRNHIEKETIDPKTMREREKETHPIA